MFIVSFETNTDAIMMKVCASRYGLPGRIIPIPHSMSAGCGMAWAVPEECEGIIREAIKTHQIPITGSAVMEYGLRERHNARR